MASWHLENCIPIHQAHSRCFGESQSPGSGCAVICREKTTRYHRKRNDRSLVCFPGRERETAGCQYRMATGTAMTSSGDNDTPVQPNVRALKRPAAVIRRRQWGRLRENHARGEIPRGAGEPPAV